MVVWTAVEAAMATGMEVVVLVAEMGTVVLVVEMTGLTYVVVVCVTGSGAGRGSHHRWEASGLAIRTWRVRMEGKRRAAGAARAPHAPPQPHRGARAGGLGGARGAVDGLVGRVGAAARLVRLQNGSAGTRHGLRAEAVKEDEGR